jgi:hypothetical protein
MSAGALASAMAAATPIFNGTRVPPNKGSPSHADAPQVTPGRCQLAYGAAGIGVGDLA